MADKYVMYSSRKWQYDLTADEWFHIACEGDKSEVQPCCGNLGDIRDLIRMVMQFQAPEEFGWRKSIGTQLLEVLAGDEDGHELSNREQYPLFNKMIDGIKKELAMSLDELIALEK
jgi:hypothetical protein